MNSEPLHGFVIIPYYVHGTLSPLSKRFHIGEIDDECKKNEEIAISGRGEPYLTLAIKKDIPACQDYIKSVVMKARILNAK